MKENKNINCMWNHTIYTNNMNLINNWEWFAVVSFTNQACLGIDLKRFDFSNASAMNFFFT